ncbi:hypothetical protein AKUH4B114J_13680 [Apilactobacillus kunkeei]|uniref:hypothetical protein n=1 Tax=Apilactobacillus kunkeei TaxID=148814 RepID=UPI001C6FA95F|nr:hypothetical protein [Apilactobacillus kunkeei]MBX8456172.1 hypothetical protein [Apilactobacillus kunkeei]QYU54331.1 hypothetical protein K2W87_06810 [Apilactobacillus kunkeei]CAI2654054.1 hypothetical protein AKUH3B202M_13710 [Apilactobacillus kunkeei]CAI2657238.1 hypothetical protein AKUH2B105J_13700 [Apilactobacillus kunkeei]CAI2658290.1 hypothetical protein AKUH3B101X_13690 [Apilactobacillus kunkeei]
MKKNIFKVLLLALLVTTTLYLSNLMVNASSPSFGISSSKPTPIKHKYIKAKKSINMYRRTNFKSSNIIKRFNKKDFPMFQVISQIKDKDNILKYYVVQINPKTKKPISKKYGFITSNKKFITVLNK